MSWFCYAFQTNEPTVAFKRERSNYRTCPTAPGAVDVGFLWVLGWPVKPWRWKGVAYFGREDLANVLLTPGIWLADIWNRKVASMKHKNCKRCMKPKSLHDLAKIACTAALLLHQTWTGWPCHCAPLSIKATSSRKVVVVLHCLSGPLELDPFCSSPCTTSPASRGIRFKFSSLGGRHTILWWHLGLPPL